MSLYTWLFGEPDPKKDLEKKLMHAVGNHGCASMSNIVGKKSTYWIMYDSEMQWFVEWEDVIAKKKYDEMINWRPALDENGEQEYHIGLPFGGEMGTACGGPRKYYHWECDMIPLMIRSPNSLQDAPQDLIDAINDNLDTILTSFKRQGDETRKQRKNKKIEFGDTLE